MRDLERIRFALTLAETGHLVFATLHTNDTSQAVDRMIDVFPGDQQPQIRVQLASASRRRLPAADAPRRGGLVGRVRGADRNHAGPQPHQGGRRPTSCATRSSPGSEDGMQTLEQSLSELVTSGAVAHDEAVTRSAFPRDVRPR